MNNICYFNLSTYSTLGGIENYNKGFLKVLNTLNCKITSVSVYDDINKEEFNNIEFRNFSKDKIKASLYMVKSVFHIEILILAHINLLPIAMILKLLNPKIKIYLTIYGVEVWKELSFAYKIFLTKIHIISISNYTTQEFIHYNNIRNQKINYLSPYIEDEITEKYKNVYNSSQFNILSVTRLDTIDNYKGIDSMIKTIPLLLNSIPNLKYTIIGKGDDTERLQDLVKELNLEKYIDFKGFVQNIESYYEYCDIFSLPSKGEGFGIVYIEAMKYKKPCIACDEGGQTDVVLDNITGFLCKYNNVNCLEKRIVELYENKRLRILFGENGYNHLMKNFTFDKFKIRLQEILNAK